MPSWWLEDADSIANENPYTFYKTPRELIEKISPGETVKLIFQFESDDPEAPRAERMWVIVKEVMGNGIFKGVLDNEPYHIKDLKIGDHIEFSACNIINSDHDDNNNLVERYLKRCFVTKKILDDGYRVGYLYREEPDNEKDSGWRITSNTETDEYMDNSENIAFVSLGLVLNKDDSFIRLLDSPAGSAYVRNSVSGEFEEVNYENEG